MELLEQILEAGIVGCGGAGFPTHAKYRGAFDTVLLNGAECEPLLRTDRYLMRHEARAIVTAAAALREAAGAQDCVIALKHTYEAECTALQQAIDQLGAPVRLHRMDSFFPAGDEQTIVYEVTGRIVPPAGLPAHVGCVVSNVATALCVADAMQGRPFTQKYLTVTGAVHTPVIVRAPIGTPVRDCIALAGGPTVSDYIVVNGGPMMGRQMSREAAEEAHVTKTMSGLLVLPTENAVARRGAVTLAQMQNRARSACIQCSFCTQLCPRHLLGHPLEPHRIMRKFAMGGDVMQMLDDPDVRNAALCCECGVCEVFACPMGLQPRRINALLKQALGKAGIRYTPAETSWHAHAEREVRKAPTGRIAARAGVAAYQKLDIDTLATASPASVALALKQSIGAPAQPVVQTGDTVQMGQKIAVCPQGALGTNLHASVDGVVRAVTETEIVIDAEKGGRG